MAGKKLDIGEKPKKSMFKRIESGPILKHYYPEKIEKTDLLASVRKAMGNGQRKDLE